MAYFQFPCVGIPKCRMPLDDVSNKDVEVSEWKEEIKYKEYLGWIEGDLSIFSLIISEKVLSMNKVWIT